MDIKEELWLDEKKSKYCNETNINATVSSHMQQSTNRRYSRHSSSSSVVSSDSLDSVAGARHNHTYTALGGQEPRERVRNVRPKLTEESEEDLQTSRDVKRLHDLNVPIDYEDIVNTPVDKFNRLLQHYRLSDQQIQFIRDVRRRGKNKVAAQNCRKRKMEVIHSLDGEVSLLQQRKAELIRERHLMTKKTEEIKIKMKELEESLLRSLQGNEGQPLNAHSFRLQLTNDGSLLVVPSNSSALDEIHNKNNRKRKGGRKSD